MRNRLAWMVSVSLGLSLFASVDEHSRSGPSRGRHPVAPLPAEIPEGTRVTSILPASVASRAGFREGDVLISLEGTKIDGAKAAARLIKLGLARKKDMEFTILRDGRTKTIRINGEKASEAGVLGITLTSRRPAEDSTPTEPTREDARHPVADNSMVVDEVLPSRPAAKAGLRAGDRILDVNGFEEKTAEALAKRLQDLLRQSSVRQLHLGVQRGDQIVSFRLAADEVRRSDADGKNANTIGLRIGAASSREHPATAPRFTPPSTPSRQAPPRGGGTIVLRRWSSPSCPPCAQLKAALSPNGSIRTDGVRVLDPIDGAPPFWDRVPAVEIAIQTAEGREIVIGRVRGGDVEEINRLLDEAREKNSISR